MNIYGFIFLKKLFFLKEINKEMFILMSFYLEQSKEIMGKK